MIEDQLQNYQITSDAYPWYYTLASGEWQCPVCSLKHNDMMKAYNCCVLHKRKIKNKEN